MVSSALMLTAWLASAQTGTDFPPPPLVPAPTPPPVTAPPEGPPPTPPPEPSTPTTPPPAVTPGTPTPGTPAPPSAVPGAPSPYGQPRASLDDKPPVEWGLMISEGLFGALTAAGVSLLPYFLLLAPFVNGFNGGVFGSVDDAVGWVITTVLFAAIPLSTAQTEVSIANGSRWYYSETWPAALVGLGVEGAVLGFSYLARGNAVDPNGALVQQRLNPIVLLVGTIGIVPLAQMAIINLFKSPRFGKPGSGGFALLNYKEGHGMTIGVPQLSPVFSADRSSGTLSGAQLSILSGRF